MITSGLLINAMPHYSPVKNMKADLESFSQRFETMSIAQYTFYVFRNTVSLRIHLRFHLSCKNLKLTVSETHHEQVTYLHFETESESDCMTLEICRNHGNLCPSFICLRIEMSHQRRYHDMITTFFVNTCRLRPQLSEYAVQAVLRCAELATVHPADDAEADYIPLITGSVAEFYIEPMLPLVGDIDVMHHVALSWQYHEDIHHQHSYQMSSATMSRYMRS